MDDTTLPPFLAALGLGVDADERGIRRAYAKLLRQIDLAREPQAFQALREAYETALRWADWRRQVAAQEGAEPPAAAEDTGNTASPAAAEEASATQETSPRRVALDEPLAAPDPQLLGQQVFDDFAATVSRVFTEEQQAKAALDAALADPRLLNLDARLFFEWRVMVLLLSGWQPGHEFLFGPACASFEWEQDRRRLGMFGPAGADLDTAVNQKMVFFHQPPGEFEAQRRLIRRLRDDTEPTHRMLVEDFPTLRMLAQRYPHWLGIVTSQPNFAKWQEAYGKLPSIEPQGAVAGSAAQAERSSPIKPASSEYKPNRSYAGWFAILAFVALVKVIGSLADAPTYRYTPPSSYTPAPAAPQWVPPQPATSFSEGARTTPPAPRPQDPLRANTWPPAGTQAAPRPVDRSPAQEQQQRRQAEAALKKAEDATRRLLVPSEPPAPQEPAPAPRTAAPIPRLGAKFGDAPYTSPLFSSSPGAAASSTPER